MNYKRKKQNRRKKFFTYRSMKLEKVRKLLKEEIKNMLE